MRVIHVLRKPLSEGSVAANVLKHGTGALNIDGCRVPAEDAFGGGAKATSGFVSGYAHDGWQPGSDAGRWPANVILQDPGAVRALDAVQSSPTGNRTPRSKGAAVQDTTWFYPNHESREYPNESGGVARFFKQIKTEGSDG